MSFSERWHTLLKEAEDLASDATLVTPLTDTRFHITDTQEHRIIIEFLESGDSQPLQREQFETLSQRIQDTADGFELDRLPPDAEPYAAVLMLHPRVEIDVDAGVIRETDAPTTTRGLDEEPSGESDRAEPDIEVYADALLLIDALERHDLTAMTDLETDVLIDLTRCCRMSSEARTISDKTWLTSYSTGYSTISRWPAQYGSIQRTSRHSKSLKDDKEVLAVLEDAGVDRDRVLGIDPDKVDDALEVTDLRKRDVYDSDERAYVRKAEVDDDVKETRLQGLKEQLAASESEEVAELRDEIEALEAPIEDLTGFDSAQEFYTDSQAN
jgi:hypothetical protein